MTQPTPARSYGSFVSLAFLVIAIVLFVLIGFGVIDLTTTSPTVGEWEAFAFASFALSFVPWPF